MNATGSGQYPLGAVDNTTMKRLALYIEGNFLSSCATVRFSRKALLIRINYIIGPILHPEEIRNPIFSINNIIRLHNFNQLSI